MANSGLKEIASPPNTFQTMNPTPPDDERLKLGDAVYVTALVAFAASAVAVTFGALAIRCVVVDAVSHLRRKGGQHVP